MNGLLNTVPIAALSESRTLFEAGLDHRAGGGGTPDRPGAPAPIDPAAARAWVRRRRDRRTRPQRTAGREPDLHRGLDRRRDHPVRGRARAELQQADRERRSRLPPTREPRDPRHLGGRDGCRLSALRSLLGGRARARGRARRLRPDGGRAAAQLHPSLEDGQLGPDVGGHIRRPNRRNARRRRLQRGDRRACEGRRGDRSVSPRRWDRGRFRHRRRSPGPCLCALVQTQPVAGGDRDVDVRRCDGRLCRPAPR